MLLGIVVLNDLLAKNFGFCILVEIQDFLEMNGIYNFLCVSLRQLMKMMQAVGKMLREVVIHLRQVSLMNTSDCFCSACVSQSANSEILSLQCYYWWQWNIIRQHLQDKSKD